MQLKWYSSQRLLSWTNISHVGCRSHIDSGSDDNSLLFIYRTSKNDKLPILSGIDTKSKSAKLKYISLPSSQSVIPTIEPISNTFRLSIEGFWFIKSNITWISSQENPSLELPIHGSISSQIVSWSISIPVPPHTPQSSTIDMQSLSQLKLSSGYIHKSESSVFASEE